MKDRIRERLQNCMDKAVANGEVGCVNFLVLENGKEKCYLESGMRDIEKGEPVTRDSIFRGYSMTKTLTSAAVMLLLQDGTIDLYDPVSKYLDGYENQTVLTPEGLVPAEGQIFIRDLLNMTSGMIYPDETPAGLIVGDVFKEIDDRLFTKKQMTTIEIAEQLGRCPLAFQPRTQWQYGTNADILGAVVEAASGKTFGKFMKENLFDPLEMEDTGFYVEKSKRSRLVKAYECSEGTAPVLYTGNHLGIRNDGKKNAFESGGAGIFTTIDDMSHFGQMLLNGGTYKGRRVMEKGIVKFMTTRELGDIKPYTTWDGLEGYNYGNLLRVRTQGSVSGMLGEDMEYGWDGWLGTYFSNAPKSDITYLMFTQVKDYGTSHLTRKLKNIFFSDRE